jgi:hypothetical protein
MLQVQEVLVGTDHANGHDMPSNVPVIANAM